METFELCELSQGSGGYVRGPSFFKRESGLWMSAHTKVFPKPQDKSIFLIQRGFDLGEANPENYMVAFGLPSEEDLRKDESYPSEAIRVLVYDFLDPFRKEKLDICNLETKIEEIESQMRDAAEKEQFDIAIRLRDQLHGLEEQLLRFPVIRFSHEDSLVLQQ